MIFLPAQSVMSVYKRSDYLKYKKYYIEYSRKHSKTYYIKNRDKILEWKKNHYKKNKSVILTKSKEYRLGHRDQIQQYNKLYRLRHLEVLREHDRNYYHANIEKIQEYRAKNSRKIVLRAREYRKKNKREVLAHYSNGPEPICAKCNEINLDLLTIDHIDGNGAQELRELNKKGGTDFYLWLKRESYPKGYQVLCYNCNWLKRYKNIETVRSRYSKRTKLLVLSHYSSTQPQIKCQNCGEERLEVLTIDHIHGGGHREQINLRLYGTEYYKHLIKLGYPKGLRVLCLNCNILAARSVN